jgi:hypothetical protein
MQDDTSILLLGQRLCSVKDGVLDEKSRVSQRSSIDNAAISDSCYYYILVGYRLLRAYKS